MKAVLYTRVSTIDKGQDAAYQAEALQDLASRKGWEGMLFSETGISGAKETRPALDELMKHLRRGEFAALCVWRLDRLGRSLPHLLQILHECDLHGVQFISLIEGMDTTTPMGRLLFNIIGGLAEFERSMIAERVQAGMNYAKAHGTRSGRPIGKPPLPIPVINVLAAYVTRLGERGLISSLAREYGVSRAWLYANVLPLAAVEKKEKNIPIMREVMLDSSHPPAVTLHAMASRPSRLAGSSLQEGKANG